MARIDFVCTSAHLGEGINRDGPTITLNEQRWAYCSRGGVLGHTWERIAPLTVDELAIKGHHATHIAI